MCLRQVPICGRHPSPSSDLSSCNVDADDESEIKEEDRGGKPSKCVLECQCLSRCLFSLKEPVYQCRLSHPLAACVNMVMFIAEKTCHNCCGLEEIQLIVVSPIKIKEASFCLFPESSSLISLWLLMDTARSHIPTSPGILCKASHLPDRSKAQEISMYTVKSALYNDSNINKIV